MGVPTGFSHCNLLAALATKQGFSQLFKGWGYVTIFCVTLKSQKTCLYENQNKGPILFKIILTNSDLRVTILSVLGYRWPGWKWIAS